MRTAIASLFLMALLAGPAAAAPPSPARILEDATEVLGDLAKIPLRGIPPKLLENAEAVVLIPRTIKVGFILGGRRGFGVAMMKNDKGEWAEPTFVSIGGASVGFQAGASSTDVVLVFRRKAPLEKILDGKTKLTLGADAAIAAGPVGRQAAAATDGRLAAEILSYSRSRGVFAGVSIDGAVLLHDRTNNDAFKDDKRESTAKALAALQVKLTEMSREPKP